MISQNKVFILFISLVLLLALGACTAPTEALATSTPLPSATETSVPPTETALPSATEEPSIPTSTPTQITLTPDPALVSGLVGLWEGSNGSYYIFQPDGVWHWDEVRSQVENSPENTGNWWIEGNIFYILDLTGPGKCPQSQTGSYQASFKDGSLILKLIHDACKVRVKQTEGLYKQLQ